MKSNLLKKILSSGVQAVSVQVLGGLFYFLIAKYLTKDDVGIYNWANGTAMSITMILSYGMDQIVLRRIAATEGGSWPAAAYLFHAIVTSMLSLLVLLVLTYTLSTNSMTAYLPLFFISQALVFIGNPLKQLLSARQEFKPFAVISIVSNVSKLIIALVLIRSKTIHLNDVVCALIACAAFEFTALTIYLVFVDNFRLKFKKTAYFKLLKEATPQFFAVIFDAILARADVFLVGILCLASVAAEYGFAYRIYEIAKLPLSVISPILLARFAPMFNTNEKLTDDKCETLQQLVNIEAFVAMLIPLVLCIIWSPLLDYFYNDKFGTVNFLQFAILSISIPISFYINMLWTIGFASKKFKQITKIIVISAVFNVMANRLLIPVWGGNGAAVSFLATTVLQLIGYHWMVSKYFMRFSSVSFFILLFTGIVAYFVALKATDNILGQLVIGIGVYVLTAVVSKQVKKQHLIIVKDFLKK